MRHYLLLGIGLALASCAAQKALPQLSEEQKRANERGIAYWQPDSASLADTAPHTPKWAVAVPPAKVDSIVVEPHRTLLDKLLGRKPEPYTLGVAPKRIGKKSTVNIYHGPATVTTTTLGKKATGAVGAGAVASVIEKKAGPAQVASDSSTQNALLGGGNLANVPGDGNTLPQTKQDTTTEAPGVGATIAKALVGPLGYVLAAAAVGGLLFLLIRRRAKNAAENLV